MRVFSSSTRQAIRSLIGGKLYSRTAGMIKSGMKSSSQNLLRFFTEALYHQARCARDRGLRTEDRINIYLRQGETVSWRSLSCARNRIKRLKLYLLAKPNADLQRRFDPVRTSISDLISTVTISSSTTQVVEWPKLLRRPAGWNSFPSESNPSLFKTKTSRIGRSLS